MTPLRPRLGLHRIRPWDGPVLGLIHAACFAAGEGWSARAFTGLLAGPETGGLIAGTAPAAPGDETLPPVVDPTLAIGDPLGLILWRHAADEAEILTLGTLPAARRTGVARVLLAAMADRLGRLGVGDIFLEVAEDNAAARGLYAATGFTVVGRRRDYYRRPDGGVDALVMRLRVPAPEPPRLIF